LDDAHEKHKNKENGYCLNEKLRGASIEEAGVIASLTLCFFADVAIHNCG
jgi:hypothetical protein